MKTLFTYILLLVAMNNVVAQKQFVNKNYRLNKTSCIVGFIPVNDSILVKQLWDFVREDKSSKTEAFDLKDTYTKVISEKECNTKAGSFLDWIKHDGENSNSLKPRFNDKELFDLKSCLGVDILIFPSSIYNETIVKQNGSTIIKSGGHFRLIDLNSGDIFVSKKIKAATHFKGAKEDWGPNGDRIEIKTRNWRLTCSALIEKFSLTYEKDFIKRNNLN